MSAELAKHLCGHISLSPIRHIQCRAPWHDPIWICSTLEQEANHFRVIVFESLTRGTEPIDIDQPVTNACGRMYLIVSFFLRSVVRS